MDQLKESFDSFTQNNQPIYYLKIINSKNFKLFPNYLLDNMRIIHLIAYHNNLTVINQDAFITKSNELLSIDLSFNQLKMVSTYFFIVIGNNLVYKLKFKN